MSRFLLLGANGQVGHELRRSLAPLGDIICTTRSGCLPDGTPCEVADFAQPDTLAALVDRVGPDCVVNAAAHTAVDRAEDEPEAAFKANAEAPARLAQACARRGIRFVHYSTDYVFDGQGTHPYSEDAATAPMGVYGESKLAGEQAVRASGAQHLIFRTSWVYGARGGNFLLTMLRLAKDRDELRVVADQYGTPTPAWLIADVTAKVLAQHPQAQGTYHLTAAGGTHWQGFAQAIIEQAHTLGVIERTPKVTPIRTQDYPTRARRPAYSRLDTSKLQALLGEELPDWAQALDPVMDQILANTQRA